MRARGPQASEQNRTVWRSLPQVKLDIAQGAASDFEEFRSRPSSVVLFFHGIVLRNRSKLMAAKMDLKIVNGGGSAAITQYRNTAMRDPD